MFLLFLSLMFSPFQLVVFEATVVQHTHTQCVVRLVIVIWWNVHSHINDSCEHTAEESGMGDVNTTQC